MVLNGEDCQGTVRCPVTTADRQKIKQPECQGLVKT